MPSLCTTRSGTSIQCSSVWRSRDKPRSNLWVPLTTRAMAFNTRCSLLVVAFGAPAKTALQCATRRTNVRVWPQILCQVNAEIAEVDVTSHQFPSSRFPVSQSPVPQFSSLSSTFPSVPVTVSQSSVSQSPVYQFPSPSHGFTVPSFPVPSF